MRGGSFRSVCCGDEARGWRGHLSGEPASLTPHRCREPPVPSTEPSQPGGVASTQRTVSQSIENAPALSGSHPARVRT